MSYTNIEYGSVRNSSFISTTFFTPFYTQNRIQEPISLWAQSVNHYRLEIWAHDAAAIYLKILNG
jgi:hypothetical protein